MPDQPFLQFNPNQVTKELTALFSPSDPASLRCYAVLAGHAAGRVFTDSPENPTWAVVQEGAFGSLFLAGQLNPAVVQQLVGQLRLDGDVLVGLWPDDPRWSFFPTQPDYAGYTLEFIDRIPDPVIPNVAEGCVLRRLDTTLAKEILDRNLLIRMFGDIQQALAWGYGLCLLRDNELLCEAFAGPAANGVIEIGVETNPHHMHKGYATLTCGHLIHEMEKQGYRTYWNCAKDNLPSAGLARRLGYQTEKEYRLLAWFKIKNES